MFHKVPWTERAAGELLDAAGSPAILAHARDEVKAGRAQLWESVWAMAKTWVVTRVEVTPEGRELVIWLGQGTGTRTVIRWFTELAKRHGMTVRAHITDDRLCRVFERMGWQTQERVVAHGR